MSTHRARQVPFSFIFYVYLTPPSAMWITLHSSFFILHFLRPPPLVPLAEPQPAHSRTGMTIQIPRSRCLRHPAPAVCDLPSPHSENFFNIYSGSAALAVKRGRPIVCEGVIIPKMSLERICCFVVILIGLLRFLQAYFVLHQFTVARHSSLLHAKIHSAQIHNMLDV